MELVTHKLDWKPQIIMPIGDIQWFGDDKEVCIEKLKQHIEWGVERGAWFIGMGDYIDAFSPSNRARIEAANLYDSARAMIKDKGPAGLVKELFERALKPSVGHWLGLLAGHHFSEYQDGTTSDMELCRLLRTKFLGDCAYLRLAFQKGKSRGAGCGTVLLWAHHGQGSGVSAASPITRLERLPKSWQADIFLMGHQSKVVAVPIDRCEPVFPRGDNGGRLVYKTTLLVATGSFMKGYSEGRTQGLVPRGTYVEKGMMAPVSLGAPVITVTPRFKYVPGSGKNSAHVWLPDLRVSL